MKNQFYFVAFFHTIMLKLYLSDVYEKNSHEIYFQINEDSLIDTCNEFNMFTVKTKMDVFNGVISFDNADISRRRYCNTETLSVRFISSCSMLYQNNEFVEILTFPKVMMI